MHQVEKIQKKKLLDESYFNKLSHYSTIKNDNGLINSKDSIINSLIFDFSRRSMLIDDELDKISLSSEDEKENLLIESNINP